MRIKDAPLVMIGTVFVITIGLVLAIFLFIPPEEESSVPAVTTYGDPNVNMTIVKLRSPKSGWDFECVVARGDGIALSCNWPG